MVGNKYNEGYLTYDLDIEVKFEYPGHLSNGSRAQEYYVGELTTFLLVNYSNLDDNMVIMKGSSVKPKWDG